MASPSSKKQELENQPISCNNNNEDLISKLPDAILTHILSLLPPQHAQRTSILSKRWQHLWTLLPDLELVMPSYFNNKFFNFVENTLIRRNSLPIRKFRLSCSSHRNSINYDRVHDLISTAMSYRVQQLDLHFPRAMDKVRLPWNHLINCQTLVELKLGKRFVLHVPSDVSFPSLRILHLITLKYIDNASIERLFAACPVLEELVLERLLYDDADNVTRVNVSMPLLRSLNWTFEQTPWRDTNNTYELMVDAPNLEYLYIRDCTTVNFVFKNLSSIVEARFDVAKFLRTRIPYSTLGDRVFGLLRTISTVKTLSLFETTIRVLGYATNNVPPKFHNLVHLNIGLDDCNGWLLLPSFLESMPNLEVLVFVNGIGPSKLNEDLFEFNWHPPEVVPACLLLKMHTIEIRNAGSLRKNERRLMKYLLKNAMRLKTLKICQNEYDPEVWKQLVVEFDAEVWKQLAIEFDPEVWKKLESYPRGSSSCEVILVFKEERAEIDEVFVEECNALEDSENMSR